jgi:redox-sensitive bicupin YhaK (pirin superfamily)
MTSGSGIIHQEMPKEAKRMLGSQLWINLPKSDKMTDPVYRDIRTEQIPTVKEEGTVVRVISGTYAGTNGPEQGDFVKTIYLDVKLEPNTEWTFGVDPRKTVFCYMVEGSALVSESKQKIESGLGVLFGEGDTIDITATKEGIRFFLYAAKPLGESIAWRGPIVMNTQDELKLASKELREGTFIKHRR